MGPDYSSYNSEELLDVKENIDSQAYPERFAAIERELTKRQKAKGSEHGTLENNSVADLQVEKKAGLVVIRLNLVPLLLLKLISFFILIFYGLKVFDGFFLEEVTGRGRIISLAENSTGYFLRMFLYLTICFATFWSLTYGIRLREKS